MKFLKVVLVFSLLAFVVPGSASAQFVPQGLSPNINVAQMGMGGLTTVVSSNAHTLFYNPGMLTRQKFVLEVTVPVGVNVDMINMANFVSEHQEEFQDFENLDADQQEQFLEDSQEFDNKWVGATVSPFIGLGWKNFGVGGYFNIYPSTKMDQGVLVPAIGLRGYGDMTLGAGVSKEFDIGRDEIGVGVTLRYMERYVIPTRRISATDAGSSAEIIQTMVDELQDPATGFAIDLGAVHALELGDAGVGSNMDIGVVLTDLYGTLDSETITPNLKAGAMYHGTSGGFLLRRFDVGLEFTDLFNRQGASFWQKINAGTEMSILGGLLTARGGIHQGYPTYGLGFRFLVAKIDFAYFTRELGNAPGQNPDDQYLAQISVGW